jgi:hypothetical protein
MTMPLGIDELILELLANMWDFAWGRISLGDMSDGLAVANI